MFFEKEYKYNIIEKVDIKIIENALERNNVHLSIIDNSTEWCAFAHYYGLKNGFNTIHCASFAYMISLFMTFQSHYRSDFNYFQSFLNNVFVISIPL